MFTETMARMKTKITKQERLQLVALFTLAQQAYKKMCEYEQAINKMLNSDGIEFTPSEIYMEDILPDIDEVLKDWKIKTVGGE